MNMKTVNSPGVRTAALSMSNRALTMGMAGLMLSGGLVGAGVVGGESNPLSGTAFAAPPTDGECGPVRIAMVLDLSTSYTPAEFAQQKQAALQTLDSLHANGGLGAEVAIYGFARDANVGDAKLIGSKGGRFDTVAQMQAAGEAVVNPSARDAQSAQRIEVDSVPANDPMMLTSISTDEGLAQAKAKINGLKQDQNFSSSPHAIIGSGSDWNWGYSESTGTNWAAALKAVQDSSDDYDSVMFVTDGVPNMIEGVPNTSDRSKSFPGEYDDGNNAFRKYDTAIAPVKQRVAAMGEDGIDVVPVYVRSTGDTQPKPDAITRSMRDLSGNQRGAEGEDWFTADNLDELAGKMIEATTATCDPAVQIDKKLATAAADIAPGSTIEYDVTVRGSGDYKSENVVVRDLGGANIDPDSIQVVDVGGKGSAEGSAWNVGELEVGESATARVTATVSEDWVPGQQIVNDINVNSKRQPSQPTSGNPNETVREDDDRFDREVVTPEAPDVKVDKSTISADIAPGGKVTYRLTVKNADDEFTARNVVAEDIAGAGLTVDSIAIEEGSRGTIDGTKWNIGDMAPGEVLTAVVTATVSNEVSEGDALVNDVIVNALGDPYEGGETSNENVDEDDDNFDREEITAPISTLKTNKEIDTAIEDLAPLAPVDYTIQVKNDGAVRAHDVVVTERPGDGFIQESVAFQEGSQSQGSFDGLTWNVGTLEPGEVATIKVRGTLAEDVTDAVSVTNVVSAENPFNPHDPESECVANEDGVDSDTDQCDIVVVTPPSSLQVDKEHTTAPEEITPGGEVTYTVTAKNNSKFGTEDVVVTDTPLEGLDPESVTMWVGGEQIEDADPEREGFQWAVGLLKPGQYVQAEVRAKLAEGTDIESFTNGVTVENPNNPHDPDSECVANEDGVNSDTDQCDIVTVETPNAPLQIHKGLDTLPDELVAGGNASFTVTVKNPGERDAHGVVVTDVPKDGLDPNKPTKLTDASQGEVDGLVWNVGTIKAGETVTVKVNGTLLADLSEGDEIANSASVENPWNPRGDSENPNDSVDEDDDQWDEDRVTVPDAVLKVRKQITSDPQLAVPGGTVTYDVEVMNDSTSAADDVVVTELPIQGIDPGSVTMLYAGEEIADADEDAEGFQWAVGRMEPGQRETAQVTATLTEDATAYDNGVTVENPNNPRDPDGDCVANNDDVTADDDQCDITENVIPAGELKVDKEITNDAAAPGEEITFQLTAKNTGPDTLTGIVVEDTPLEGLDPESVVLSDPSVGEVDGLVWNVGTLEADQEATVTVTATISEGTEGTEVRNGTTIENPQNPKENTPDGECQVNEGVDADEDQCDIVTVEIPEPETPEEPTPEDPETPGDPEPEDPKSPEYPEKPEDPSDPEGPKVNTGGDSPAAAMGLAGALMAAGAGALGWLGFRRFRKGGADSSVTDSE